MTAFNSTIENTDPRNVETEQALLGALLRNNDLYESVSEILIPEHFYEQAHADVWRLIVQALDNKKSATVFTINQHIEKSVLSALCDGTTSPTNREFRDWAAEIAEQAARRGIVKICRETIEDAVTAPWGTPPDEMVAAAEAKLFRLTPESANGGPVGFDTALDEAMDAIDAAQEDEDVAKRVVTGLVDLDAELGRLNGGDLVVLAGRASMGKSALGMDIAENNVVAGRRVAFFSLEMTRKQLAMRRMARRSRISMKRQLQKLSASEYQKVLQANQELRNLPLHIDDRPKLTLAQIRATCRRLHRKHGLSAVVIDYLQIMGDDPTMAGAPRTYQVGYNTAGLKALAKELDIPIIALAQVGRGVEKQEDKRPGMSDLSDSKSIEMDADVIMFVFREAYYMERSPPIRAENESLEKFDDRVWDYNERLNKCRGVGDVIVAKARNGNAPAIVKLSWDGEATTFGNLHK